jgi:outer membrane receptor protein involved in Fe transport
MEVWLPSSINLKPQIADQFVLGYQQVFGKDAYSFSLEGFYKKMHNQIEYTDHAQMLFNPFIEGELRNGTARSSGIEFMLSKNEGTFTGWISYTLSKTLMKFEEINFGHEFPASYDRPNDLCVVANYKVKPRWQISAGWLLMSGGAYTAPTGFYVYNNAQIPVYEKRNNERLPVYHRLDLATELQLNKPGSRSEHKLKISLFNAYARKNPIAINYNKISDDNNNIMVPANYAVLPELVSTMTYLFGIVPSVSYSFSF